MDPKSRSFLGALAAAIKAFALVFINLMNVADNAVAMADKAVKTARKRQAIDLAGSMAKYAQRAKDQAAMEQVKSELEVKQFINGDETKQKMFDQASLTIGKLIDEELKAIDDHDITA